MRFASHFDTEEEEHQCTSYCLRGDHKERIAKRFLISSKELEILWFIIPFLESLQGMETAQIQFQLQRNTVSLNISFAGQ